jgi:glycosyltransferase involved in cell wall biosynthesis
VWGEVEYFNRLYPRIRELVNQGQWEFLGVLSLSEMASYYPNLDVIVVPSLNSTETFGFVQIEAMMNGVPAIASDLPGVRQPVGLTGMGKIIPVGDSNALSNAIIEVFESPGNFRGDTDKIIQKFKPDTTAARYEELFKQLRSEIK